MNSIQIIGNLTRDPESRTTPKGDTICTFTVACDRRFMVNGERVTDFFRINAWRSLGETCLKFLSKGKKVYVSGELQARLYENNSGETKLSLDIDADRIEFLSPRGENAATSASDAPVANNAPAQADSNESDDCPF